ncbi:MAG: hypothetical protein GIX03_15750, partial [Candidatus Eremiobacteraeota bacterium]|nr:hypothetical protein [Candidatus Eremiobacteraeota bacterium]
MDAALNPAPGAPPSRPPILAVAMPAAGLVFVAIALSDLASHARLTISSAELWTMSALGTGGIVVFFLSLLFSVGGRQRELAGVAEGLSR